MARSKYYSPALSRFIVSVLFHHAKAKKIPMTKLADDLLRQSLVNTDAWRLVETLNGQAQTNHGPSQAHAA
jgi:hypothetical protein